MKKITLITVYSFVSLFIVPFYIVPDEEYCLIQENMYQGYCDAITIKGAEGEDDILISRCVAADMSAPNESGKQKCSGNSIEPLN
ncbi:hypothetical protein AWW67_15090 [Roseivirga seohaensis]|uniref:Uncharacterized protein n=1 Tax=Roseivirga seohaensis TaxID=1914963 RepID=A0A150Y3F7_9BACT|nr:hypothetical protein [Roseivirga seohaensis]KYG85454.1 hypothetical protein AWW67_15090 [Roseivirga seohaensis]